MDIFTLAQSLLTDGTFQRVTGNPRAQFGLPGRRYIGAEILPERQVQLNAYREDQIKYRSVIANAGERYSPVQLKGGSLVGSFLVELAESDIGSIMTSRELDGLRRILNNGATLDAEARLINWMDVNINIPLIEYNERSRWQALVGSQVQLRGDNEYTENIDYVNPSGHRAAAGGSWSNDTYDPTVDIFAMADLLASKGHPVRRIIASRNVVSLLAGNDKIKTRTSRVVLNTSGQVTAAIGRVTVDEINTILGGDGLPPIEQYDLQYRTSTGVGRFLANNVMVFIGATGEQEQLDLGDVLEPIDNVLGYVGVGIPAGQDGPGRALFTQTFRDKPPRIVAEGWQTSLPVITTPEAVAVITGIA